MKQSTQRSRSHGKKSRAVSLARARAAKLKAQEVPSSPPPATPVSEVSTPSTADGCVDQCIPIRESASKRKLHLAGAASVNGSNPQSSSLPFAFIDLNILADMFARFRCDDCGHRMSLRCGRNKGFVHSLSVVCPKCSEDVPDSKPKVSACTSRTLESSKAYELNRKTVAAFLNIGVGFSGINSFCEVMGMEGITHNSYAWHVSSIYEASTDIKDDILKDAIQKVRSSHGAEGQDVLDVAASFDGSWHKRGHTSKHGVAAVIEITTGLVVDYHVMSTFCHLCSTIGKSKGDAWHRDHAPNCTMNHSGSSGLMEVEAAKKMWLRSEGRGLRYTTMVSDGDCKTFNELLAIKPYSVPVEKEECTNHVSKRLGTALRNLISTESKRNNPLGGRKQGSLTQVKIGLLQKYYKSAVASKCQSTEELRQKIWRTFLHASSTDEAPQHQFCPKGPLSSCFYQRALAHNVIPPSHSAKPSSVFISPSVAAYVKPIYERLTSDALLSRCLKGMTQNANESLHATIWARCPKHLFVGRKRIEIASALSIGQFNSGSSSLSLFLRKCGILGDQHITVNKGRKRDRSRIEKAEKKETLEAKRRRTEMYKARCATQQQLQQREGGPSYLAGGF